MDGTTQVISIILIVFTWVALSIGTVIYRRRRQKLALRDIAAYSGLPLTIGMAIEANRPVHMSLGSAGLGRDNTAVALASAEMFYQAARRAAISATSPIITVSDTTAIPLAQDTLRRAMQSRDLLSHYEPGAVRWYPAGPRSLAFAAALTATLGDDDVGANLLVGSFGPELALIAEAAQRRSQPLIAASDQLTGQAVAYAFADAPLIGEELFAAGAYLGEAPNQTAMILTQDFLRWMLIFAIIALAVLTVISGG